MRILVTSVRFPFIKGGAESLVEGLLEALRMDGHEVDLLSSPFRFEPPVSVRKYMDLWESEELTGMGIDAVICLSFPTYYLKHPNKIVWLLHQHRAVYDLRNCRFFSDQVSERREGEGELRTEIPRRDTLALQECKRIFTISQTVSERLQRFNYIESTPVYPPPLLQDRFYSAPPEPFIFFPSRLEELKRQTLLIGAMSLVKSPVFAFFAGQGGQRPQLMRQVLEHGLEDRVVFLGRITDEELLSFYANCLAVFFGPYKEDLGFVTQEAMLSKKPVITCTDSGGATEFVTDGVTGFVVEPTAEAIAKAIDYLYENPSLCQKMGTAAYQQLSRMEISWSSVLRQLIGD